MSMPASQSDLMNEDLAFWDALTAANLHLQEAGIYLTHIFEERQIIIGRDWFARRVAISRPKLNHIRLYRPGTLDLILTKMMRGSDPQHMDEIRWMIANEGITRADLELAFESPQMPDEEEIAESFEVAKHTVLAQFAANR
jgi:hypothetical protein